jgi:hypothetical protein
MLYKYAVRPIVNVVCLIGMLILFTLLKIASKLRMGRSVY